MQVKANAGKKNKTKPEKLPPTTIFIEKYLFGLFALSLFLSINSFNTWLRTHHFQGTDSGTTETLLICQILPVLLYTVILGPSACLCFCLILEPSQGCFSNP